MDLGTLFGLFGLAFALYAYLKTRNKVALVIDHDHYVVLGKRSWPRFVEEHISVRYKDKIISRYVRTYILAWNGSDKTLGFDENLNEFYLRLPNGSQILNCGVRINDDEANQAGAKALGPEVVKFSFEYLRSKEAVVYFVDHDADEKELALVVSEKTKNLIKKNFISPIAYLQALGIFLLPRLAIGLACLLLGAAIVNNASVIQYIVNVIAGLGKEVEPDLIKLSIVMTLGTIFIFSVAAFSVIHKRSEVWPKRFLAYRYGKAMIYYQDVVKVSPVFFRLYSEIE
jgi:hypothetical protein